MHSHYPFSTVDTLWTVSPTKAHNSTHATFLLEGLGLHGSKYLTSHVKLILSLRKEINTDFPGI